MKKLLLVCFASLALVAFSMPAMAATTTVTWYGNVRSWTGYQTMSKDYYDSPFEGMSYRPVPFNTSTDYKNTMNWDMLDRTNSRLGVVAKNGPVSANIEVRPNTSSYIRLFNASYNFGPATVTIGQAWAPDADGVISNQCWGEGISGYYGDMWGSLRVPLIQFTVPFQMGEFKVAFMEPNTGGEQEVGTAALPLTPTQISTTAPTQLYGSGAVYQRSLPKIVASMHLNLGMASLIPFAGYENYTIKNNAAVGGSQNIDAYIYGAKAVVNAGPATVNLLGWGGQNTYNYGLVVADLANYGTESSTLHTLAQHYDGVEFVNGSRKDATVYGGGAVIDYHLTDIVMFEGGYLMTKATRYKKESDDQAYYYVNATINCGGGFALIPEIGRLDRKKLTLADGTKIKEGNLTYYGVYWRINF